MGSPGQGELIALLLPPGSPSSVTPILLHITYWVDTYRRVRCRSRCNPCSHNRGGSDRERTSIHVVLSLSDFQSNKTVDSLVAVGPTKEEAVPRCGKWVCRPSTRRAAREPSATNRRSQRSAICAKGSRRPTIPAGRPRYRRRGTP
jgi:hypothetical protein